MLASSQMFVMFGSRKCQFRHINDMSGEKFTNVAKAALEITKMVLIITANTTCKLLSVGKNEIKKQYQEYNQKATPEQKEAMKIIVEAFKSGTASVKAQAKQIKLDPKKMSSDIGSLKKDPKDPSNKK